MKYGIFLVLKFFSAPETHFDGLNGYRFDNFRV